MHWRELDIRRRVRRWRDALKVLWWTGRLHQHHSDLPTIRARVDAFRAQALAKRIAMNPREYGDLSDQAFLVDLVDELSRQLAHFQKAATAQSPAMPAAPATIDTEIDIRGADPWEGRDA